MTQDQNTICYTIRDPCGTIYSILEVNTPIVSLLFVVFYLFILTFVPLMSDTIHDVFFICPTTVPSCQKKKRVPTMFFSFFSGETFIKLIRLVFLGEYIFISFSDKKCFLVCSSLRPLPFLLDS